MNGGGGGSSGNGDGGEDGRGFVMTRKRALVGSELARLGSGTAAARGTTSPLPGLGAVAADDEDIAELVDEHDKTYFHNKKSGVAG